METNDEMDLITIEPLNIPDFMVEFHTIGSLTYGNFVSLMKGPCLYRGYYLMKPTTRCIQRRSRVGLCGLCVCIFIHFNLPDPSDQDPHPARRHKSYA